MEYFKKFGWVLLAGLISFVIFVILLFGLSAVVEYFREQQMLEPRLFFDSFLVLGLGWREYFYQKTARNGGGAEESMFTLRSQYSRTYLHSL